MDSGALRLFQAVAEAGSVTEAARRLNTVQSNVTTRLRKLEDELGVTLFDRRPRRMELTDAGTILLGYAERVGRLLAEARDAVAEAADEGALLPLGSMESTAATRLPPALAAFHQAHPKVQLSLSTGPTEQIIDEVVAGRLIGAFVAGPLDHPELTADLTLPEELVLVRPAQPMADAARTVFVFRRGCTYRAVTERLMRERGLVPHRSMEFGTLDGILGCVAAGMGVTVTQRRMAERSPHAGLLVIEDLPPHLGCVDTLFVRRRDGRLPRSLARLLEIVKSGWDADGERPISITRHPGEQALA